jgi:hypothetical protein
MLKAARLFNFIQMTLAKERTLPEVELKPTASGSQVGILISRYSSHADGEPPRDIPGPYKVIQT